MEEVFPYFKSREQTIFVFEKDYPKEIEEITKCINKTFGAIEVIILRNNGAILSSKIEELALLLRSIDFLITSLILAKQRANFESLTILRLALETSSTAFQISKDEKAFINYKQGKYNSTDSIKFIKKQIKPFGEIWGALSRACVHVNSTHGIFSILLNNHSVLETYKIEFGIKSKNEEQDKSILLIIQLGATIIHKIYELIFFSKALWGESEVLYQKETNLLLIGKRTEELIEELYKKIKE